MILKLLKLGVLLITSALGIYGTTHDFKKRGKLTQAGRLAVVGLIVSAVLAIALQFVEFNEEEDRARVAKREADESTERQQRTLEQTNGANQTLQRVVGDIDRGVNRLSRPLGTVLVSCQIEYDHAEQLFPEYWAKLKDLYARAGTPAVKAEDAIVSGDEMTLPPPSAYFPTDADGNASALNYWSARITYRDSKASNEIQWNGLVWSKQGQRMFAGHFPRGLKYMRMPKDRSEIWLTVDIGRGILRQEIRQAPMEIVQGSKQFTSSYDITDPPDPETLAVELGFDFDSRVIAPKLTEFTMHFGGANYADDFEIPIEALKMSDQPSASGSALGLFGHTMVYHCSVADMARARKQRSVSH